MLQTNEFKQLLHESAKKMAKVIANEKTDERQLQPPKVREKQIQHQLEEHALQLEKKMYEGLQVCLFALNERRNPSTSFDEVVQELVNCMSVINSPEAFSKLGQALLSDTSWKSHLRLSDKCLKALYEGAKCVFDKKDYMQAEKAFFVLCSLDPTQFTYWVGFGHSSFHNKNYEQAINGYSMASILDPEDAWPHIWAANTFEESKDFAHAKMALTEALNLEKEKTEKNHELIRSLEERFQNIKAR